MRVPDYQASTGLRETTSHVAVVQAAVIDAASGPANGVLLTERLTHALAVTRSHNSQLGVIFVDVDQFKMVNDCFGHRVGDALLAQVADRIAATVRVGDAVVRFGGDEFIIVCDAAAQVTEQTAERVLTALRQPFRVDDLDITVTASVGIAIADDDSTPDSVLRDSDDAMCLAKRLGRDRIQMFDHARRTEADQRLHTTTALRRAMDRNELSVDYQPVIELTTGKIVSAEALLRWNHPDRGTISPVEFIPIAEAIGLIVPIGAWVLEQACQQLSRWHRTDPSMSVAVNLSVRQVMAPNILEQIAEILTRTGIRPECLYLELTESIFVQDVEYCDRMLTGLKDLGVQLSLDDFGTGYSSLSYLSRFPFDVVKIDRAFVRGLGTNPHDTALVAAILSMADALGLSVTAEGIEDESQLSALRMMNCERGQGFYFDRPMAADSMNRLIVRSRHPHLDLSASPRSSATTPMANVTHSVALIADTPPASAVRTHLDIAAILLDSTRMLLRVTSPEQAVGALMRAVVELGGTCVPASRATADALPIDISLGQTAPLLPTAPSGSTVRRTIEHVLPSLVEDARAAADNAGHITSMSTQIDTDPLTGLGNRRGLGRIRRHIEHDTVAMLDLDHFKHVNDLHGHDAGDRLLVAFSRMLRQRLRVGDLVFRLGGEEFLLILPDTSPQAAMSVMEQLRRKWENDRPIPVTFSAGIAQVQDGDLDTAMRTADGALYAAKAGGRDRFEMVEPVSDANAGDLAAIAATQAVSGVTTKNAFAAIASLKDRAS